jgi:hypothetical protein
MKAVKRELVHHKRDVELAAAGAVLVVGAGVALAVSRHRYRERHRLERRLRAVSRAWSHPERLATKADDRPLGEAIARSILMAGLTTLGAQLGKRLARDFLPAKR